MIHPKLGLGAGWQARMIAAATTYDAIFERTIGAHSPLGLPRGINRSPAQGGLLGAPFAR